jgi:protein-S-isoprenylcysteine O-methyltransferase Ste14
MTDPGTPLSPARMAVRLVIIVLVLPALPILLSGDWAWREGWAFFLVLAIGFVASRALAARRHPDLMAERARAMQHEDAKGFDKLLAPLVALGVILVGIVAGIDHRWHRATAWFPAWSRWAALAVVILGYVFGTWALMENRFFSGVVRIQHDRGHHVVSSGPYRLVRHPGYAGTMVCYPAFAVLLASLWAFAPAVISLAALVVRTALEDRTLRAELPGYAEYAQRTRYRLFPGVW